MSHDKKIDVAAVTARLIFISQIKKGEKIDTKNVSVSTDTIISRLSRTFDGKENRHRSLSFISSVTAEALMVIDTLTSENFDETVRSQRDRTVFSSGEESQLKIAGLVIGHLKNVHIGIDNLKETYASDLLAVSQMTAFVEFLQVQIEKAENAYLARLIRRSDEEMAKKAERQSISASSSPQSQSLLGSSPGGKGRK